MFSKDILEQAFELKEKECNRRKARYNEKMEKVRVEYPRLDEIDSELSKIGTSLMVLALSGKTDEILKAKSQSEKLCEEKNDILKKSGIKPYKPICPICDDNGRKKGEICECIKQIAKELSIIRLNETAPVKKSRFEDFNLEYYPPEVRKKMKNIYDFSLDYANSFSKNSTNVLFMGKCGLGKTHLSLSIASAVTEKGYGVLYGSAQDIFSKAEKEHFSYSAENRIRDELLSCDLLILDDLGTEFATSFTQSLLYNIVNTRILNNIPTIINTNLDFNEIEERYSTRIASRLLGEYTIKQFAGNDVRQLKAMEKLV